ncbi:MAG TPA: TonB-dependent receptor [Steroidobacteraceae bacterium]|jgi:TonB-dependent receptor
MKSNLKVSHFKPRFLFTIVGGAVLINPAFAQEAKDVKSDQLEEVVVTGMRQSLKTAMETKRDAAGVVDAINAEDIGKFPDTNLSEALQRIPGISIDRRNGEGALVTARGFGAQYNMVTLNGRMMPSADAFADGSATGGGVGGNSRSFNFANLAAESISAVEIYKTGRADIATGGIGASINVKTAKPFDNRGMVFSFGAKAIDDTTNRVGSDITPEVSGIFSYANDDRTWGIGLSASYQKRDSGSEGATVNDWHIQPWSANMADNQTLAPLSPTATIVNAPATGQLYGIPNDIRYVFADRERERTNGQLTVQFAPIDSLTLTADYTYALNTLTEDRGEQTVWLQRNGFTHVEFDTGQAVATPVVLAEMTGASKDFGYEQQHREQKNDLKSVGFNADWKMTDRFSLALDYHDSKAESLPDDPITGGGQTAFSVAGKVPSTGNCTTGVCSNFWTQTFQFNNGLPIAARTLYPTNTDALAGTNGNPDYSFSDSSLGSQVLRIAYQDQVTEIKQGRLDGALDFDNGRLQFGVETRSMQTTQRASASNLTMGDWGVGDAGAVPDLVALLQPFSLTGAFDDFNPNGAPRGGWKGNADVLGQWAMDHGYTNWTEDSAPDGQLRFNPGYNTNNKIEEDTKAVYFQFAMNGELGSMPAHLLLGARYEQTKVKSVANILVPTALLWQDDNDFQVVRPTDLTPFAEKAEYNNLLPSLDFDLDLTSTLKGRFSYSKTIARAGYGQLAAGASPNTPGGSTLNGFQATADANNPGLVPLESDNFDLSLEWYFSDSGYVSAGFFEKRVANFIGNTVTDQGLFGIQDQTAGPRAQYALNYLKTHNLGTDDSALFTLMAMIDNPGTFTDANGTWTGGEANYNGSNAQHVAFASRYDLLPQAADPEYNFGVTQPVNNKDAKIHGWELGGQYFFGSTGFGILANYTIVRGDVGYNNASDPNENQFALLGLSDSANAVLMYEKYGFSARLAYNWRDEFLQSVNQGTWRNPIYVDAYDQFDLSLGYEFNANLALSFEAINLTGEDIRWHGRSDKQLWYLEDQGPRYALGARYKF